MGDGAATLCAVLLAGSNQQGLSFDRGWKKRVAIKDSRRERWVASSDLFSLTEGRLQSALQELGFDVQRRRIEGEPDLLLMYGTSGAEVISFGVRNSGTQAKTNLSVRLSKDLDPQPFEDLLEAMAVELCAALTDD